MTRRTQKSSLQRKRQYTRRRGGAYGKRGKCLRGFIELLVNGVRQCIQKKRTENTNNDKYEIVNDSGYKQLKEHRPKKINNKSK